MSNVFRKLRGVVGVGLTWGLTWAALGALLGIVIGIVRPQDLDPGENTLGFARILGTAGFISGAGFALVLAFAERGRTVLDVSLGRVALWGLVGGATIPLLTPVANSMVFWTCPLGALLAAGAVAMARRGERRRLAHAAALGLTIAEDRQSLVVR